MPIGRDDCFLFGIDVHGLGIEKEVYIVLVVPLFGVDINFIQRLFTGQNRGKKDAIIIVMRLFTQNRDLKIRFPLKNLDLY